MSEQPKMWSLWLYVAIIFILQTLSLLFATEFVSIYLSISIFVIGGIAMLFQKFINRKPLRELGLSFNKSAKFGVIIGILYALWIIVYNYGIPLMLKLAYLEKNPQPPNEAYQLDIRLYIVFMTILDGSLMFIASFFGEELAFRGYILKHLEFLGNIKAILIGASIFALWHLPVYFSLYVGRAVELGGGAVALMILGHFVSSIPLYLLYLSTHDLYGVSIIHAIVDLIQYQIIQNPGLGDASIDALYFFIPIHQDWLTLFAWIGQGFSIGLMLLFSRWMKRKLVRPI